MAVTGRKPKPRGQAVNRVPPKHDWTDVVDVPFEGESPELPDDVSWSKHTHRWWEVVRHLPHAVLWHPGDWLSAVECAFVVEQHWQDPTSEMRIREKSLGLTSEALRDLRIRYVPAPEVGDTRNVAKLDDYRDL